jgi:hypothetical protein
MKTTKYLRFVLGFFLMLSAIESFGQTDIINQVKETIKAGSAKELARYLNQTVYITIEGNVETYSKAQAEFVLRDFFKQHAPSEVSIIHQGSSKGGQPFAILQYKSGAETYRLFMKIKTVNNAYLLDDIRFTKE